MLCGAISSRIGIESKILLKGWYERRFESLKSQLIALPLRIEDAPCLPTIGRRPARFCTAYDGRYGLCTMRFLQVPAP